MWKTYNCVVSVEEALFLLSKHSKHARLVAGATDLMIELEQSKWPRLEQLIDITRVPGLDQITLSEDGWVHLGPLVTHNDIVASQLIHQHGFVLADACREIGAAQIRNRGTIAGNLVTASPAGDAISPLIALGAQVTLRSLQGERVVSVEDFITGVRCTLLADDEMLTDIAFPALGENERSAFYKVALRKAQAISLVNVAVVLSLKANKVDHASITLGAVAPTVVHAEEAEKALLGQKLTPKTIEAASEAACTSAHPIDDIRATADYRREMVAVALRRCLQTVATDQKRNLSYQRSILLRRPNGCVPFKSATTFDNREAIICTTVNGKAYQLPFERGKTLLRLLREDIGLTGTKEGCNEGECGACTVILDGRAVMSCLVPAPRAHYAEITTIEGLNDDDHLHPLQKAFIDMGAVQCGYCTPGFLVSGSLLLEEVSNASHYEIEQALSGNLCRCTGYYKIIAAVEKAVQTNHQPQLGDDL